MIATKTNLEITEYREKFFLGLSLRQLACFAAAAVLAIATCFVFLHWLRMDIYRLRCSDRKVAERQGDARRRSFQDCRPDWRAKDRHQVLA